MNNDLNNQITRSPSKRMMVRILIGLVIIAALMLTMHVLINSFDLLSFMRGLHGG
jgi:hypothetical protein